MTTQQFKSLPIRQAIKQVVRKAQIARDTSNRELLNECCQWLRYHIPQRNNPNLRFFA